MPDKENSNNEDVSPIEILTQIKNGILDPKSLSAEKRQEVVEHLWLAESQKEAVIAHILKKSVKTIQRDKDIVRERNAKRLTPEGKSKIVGELIGKLITTHENLMRLSGSKDGSIQENAQAGIYATNAILELGKMLQGLGYLNSTGQRINISIREEEPTPDKLKEELARLEKIASGKNVSDPEVAKLMEEMKYHIAIAEAKERLIKLEEKLKDKDSPSA